MPERKIILSGAIGLTESAARNTDQFLRDSLGWFLNSKGFKTTVISQFRPSSLVETVSVAVFINTTDDATAVKNAVNNELGALADITSSNLQITDDTGAALPPPGVTPVRATEDNEIFGISPTVLLIGGAVAALLIFSSSK